MPEEGKQLWGKVRHGIAVVGVLERCVPIPMLKQNLRDSFISENGNYCVVGYKLSQEVHHRTNAGTQVVFHAGQTAPEHAHGLRKHFRELLDNVLRDGDKT